MDRWDVNAIVLNHRNRFFTAATLAGRSLDASGGTLLSLLGNLAWASSSFIAKDRKEAAAMAFGGALLGSLGPAVDGAGGLFDEHLRRLERAFDSRHDEIVAFTWDSLLAAGLLDGSPASVNEHVWKVLFPLLTYRQSLGELVGQLCRELSE